MALVIPVSCSTFGDASVTEGPLRKYVLAQFRSDADLGWVGALRAELSTAELKYRELRDNRVKLKQNSGLWQRIERGVGQATLVVIDPEPVASLVTRGFTSGGAVPGVDFSEETVMDGCAAAIVGGTPIAHLPTELATVSGWPARRTLEDFTPPSIRSAIGSGLRAAQVFAARAHATFDVVVLDETARNTRDTFRSPLARVILTELLSTRRVFDRENRPSVDVLNRASDAIADGLRQELGVDALSAEPLARECDSRAVDHLQAADIAAGWARDTIDTAGVRALGTRFERVWVNGALVKGTYD